MIMKKLCYILLFFYVTSGVKANDASVMATIDTNNLLIGEQTNITLSTKYRVDQGAVQVVFPQLNDTINKAVEIVSRTAIDTLIPDADDPYLFEQRQQIIITSFDSGYHVIPPFHFVINQDTLSTEAMLLEVNTPQVDTSQAIFDIKSPLEEPFNLTDWIKQNWTWIVGILVLIALIIGMIRYFKQRKPNTVEKEEIIPEIPPHIIALEQLQKIADEQLWQQDKIKQYHSNISETIRAYIEKRYHINALEQTTDEILHGLRLVVTDGKLLAQLRQLLMLSDLVKFAKEKPLASENEAIMQQAIAFVESTKEVIIENNHKT